MRPVADTDRHEPDPCIGTTDADTWRAVPHPGNPAGNRGGAWWIVAGDYADEGEPDVLVEVTAAEYPKDVAEFIVTAIVNEHARQSGQLPMIAALCGSTRFREEFSGVNRDLTKQGVVVLAPGVFGHSGDAMTAHEKDRLDALHLQKITMADEVFVVNPGGYVGESTRREIAYAQELGRPIRYLVQDTAGGDAR